MYDLDEMINNAVILKQFACDNCAYPRITEISSSMMKQLCKNCLINKVTYCVFRGDECEKTIEKLDNF